MTPGVYKNLFVLESLRHLAEAGPYAEKDTLFLATTPVVRDRLDELDWPAIDSRELIPDDDLWLQYPGTNRYTDDFCHVLTRALKEVDPEFPLNEFPVFRYLSYPIKICVDQLLVYALQLTRAIRPGLEAIHCSDVSVPLVDDLFLFHTETSVFRGIAEQVAEIHSVSLKVYPSSAQNMAREATPSGSFSFGQPVRRALGRLRRGFKAFGKHPAGVRKLRILSIGCHEIASMRAELAAVGVQVVDYPDEHADLTIKSEYPLLEEVVRRAGQLYRERPCLVLEGVDLLQPMLAVVRSMLRALPTLRVRFERARSYFASRSFDAIFVQTLAPFYTPPVIAHALRAGKEPIVCWMHGGYGAYPSLPGYDVTDYALTRNHVVYGQAVKDAILDPECILHKTSPDATYNLLVAGSPRFHKVYADARLPERSKKRIMLSIGGLCQYNQFYLGYDRPDTHFWNYDEHRAIIKVLAEFEDKYEIIIKDYPSNNMKGTWLSMLARLGSKQIRVVTDEMGFDAALLTSDLNIFSWVSTTFIQALYTSADIFLLDRSRMTEPARALLNTHIAFSSDSEIFSNRLRDYLARGAFHTQDKLPLQDYFVNHSRARDANAIRRYIANLGKGAS